MKHNIFISDEANIDFYEILEYLPEVSETAQKKFRESYDKFIERVSNMPFMFGKYEYNPKYRKASLEYDYLVLYNVDKRKKVVEIHRILNSKRNIENLI